MLTDVGQLHLKELPLPKVGQGEVLIKVETALTCGTDLKAYLRGHPKWPMPTPFGHEFSGTVVEVGGGVDKKFQPGVAVMGVPSAPCHTCDFCKRNLQNLCEFAMQNFLIGAYSEYLCIPEHIVKQHLFVKPNNLSFAEAALLEPLACVVHSLLVQPVEPKDNVVVIGTGPIALMHMMLAKYYGANLVVAIGRRPYRLEKAAELGADIALSANKDNVTQAILDATASLGADKVYECTGLPEVWEQTPDYTRFGGSIMLFGGCKRGTRASFDTYKLHYGQLTLRGAFHYTPEAVRLAYALLCEKKLPFEKLITGTFELDKLEQALKEMQQGECIKLAMVTKR